MSSNELGAKFSKRVVSPIGRIPVESICPATVILPNESFWMCSWLVSSVRVCNLFYFASFVIETIEFHPISDHRPNVNVCGDSVNFLLAYVCVCRFSAEKLYIENKMRWTMCVCEFIRSRYKLLCRQRSSRFVLFDKPLKQTFRNSAHTPCVPCWFVFGVCLPFLHQNRVERTNGKACTHHRPLIFHHFNVSFGRYDVSIHFSLSSCLVLSPSNAIFCSPALPATHNTWLNCLLDYRLKYKHSDESKQAKNSYQHTM